MSQETRARVTLRDIALQSGYTVNTVSHALRGKSDISAATRKKILDIAGEMGYVGNALASSLRSGRSNTIAVIVSDVINPHFSFVVHNIEACAREGGYSTIVLSTGDVLERECQAVKTALSHLVDGVLICPSQLGKEPLTLLRQSGMPYVIMGRQFQDEIDNQVLLDDEGGAYLLTESLIARGHRRILYVGGNEQFSSQAERLSGYRRAMKGAGIGDAEQLVCPYARYAALEEAGTLQKLTEEFKPTAIFAFRDEMAWTIINQLRPAGVEVPRDVSVAGFDYTAEHLRFLPALTTVAAQFDNYSTVAARRLLDLIRRGGQPPRTIRLAMRLIEPDATVGPVTK